MYRRQLSKALSHHDVRDLDEAVHFAEKRGKPITATLTVNPAVLESYPDDLGKWTGMFLNKLRIWCERAGFGYFAVWVRENYVGERREHLHVLLYVPERHREAVEAAARRWLPGRESVVQLGRPKFRRDRLGRRTNKALTYVMKQMTPQAWVALNRNVRREKHCRHTGEAIAPVLGKRCGVSRSLNKRTRQTFWTSPIVRPVKPPQATPQDKAA